MNLTPDTISILKNFAAINPSIKFNKGSGKGKKSGSVLRTISSEQSICVDSRIADVFPQDFCIFDLRLFLSVLDLFKSPSLEFENDKYVLVKETGGKSSVKYFFTNESMITVPREDLSGMEKAISDSEIKFTISQADLASILKAASVLQSSNIAVIGNSEGISIATLDPKSSTSNSYIQEVSEGNGDTFRMIFNTDNIKILPGTYEVSISSQGISAFRNTDIDHLIYYIALEESSEYTKGNAA